MNGKKRDIDLNEVKRLAGQGLTLDQIARCLGIARTTFWQARKADEELQQALEDGKAEAVRDVTNALYQKALEGDNTAMIFWLKNRAGWADAYKHEVTNKSPDEMTIDELAEQLRSEAGVSSPTRSH